MPKTRVSIIGGSGYAGGELVRLLLSHPEVILHQITSRRFVGQPLTLAHPNLRGLTQQTFIGTKDLESTDVLFFALPNKQSMTLMPQLKSLAKIIIDLGADYRLDSATAFKDWYGLDHADPDTLTDFTYGLVEVNRHRITTANHIACGGCEATSLILGLYPLVKLKLIDLDHIIADIKIGSSAAGSHSSASSHHPERHGVLRSYKPTHHRHQAEVDQILGTKVQISATSVNLVRGILATIHTKLKPGLTDKDVWKAYRQTYSQEPFIRLVKQKTGLYRYPEPKLLWGTNYCDIGFELDPTTSRLVVLSAIDNLVKGTAGQAVQAMNVRLAFMERHGLGFPGLHPV